MNVVLWIFAPVSVLCGLWALYMFIDWVIHGCPNRFK